MSNSPSTDAIANIRRRICSVMNKARTNFQVTPDYDDFLSAREDLIDRFIQLSRIDSVEEAAMVRDRLSGILADYERVNEEQILATRSTEEQRRKEKAMEIIREEGLLYERINSDYSMRDRAVAHPLESLLASQVLRSTVQNAGNSSAIGRRKCRPMPSTSSDPVTLADSLHATVAPAGVAGLWQIKALQTLRETFEKMKISNEP